MSKTILTSSRAAALLWLITLILLPLFVNAQGQKSQPVKGYGEASYTLKDTDQFMKTWLMAGPVPVSTGEKPTDEEQAASFKQDIATVAVGAKKAVAPMVVNGKSYSWEVVKSGDGIVDLDKHYGQKDFHAAFAMAEIVSDKEAKMVLGVGSDDGIRIWHNGKLIHDNWTGRGVVRDDDIVPITLQRGSNQILVKVQDMQQGWGFAVRVLSAKALSDQLVAAAGNGDLDAVNVLLTHGATLDHTNALGLTALNSARISGHEDVVKVLREKGAVDTPVPSLEKLIDGMYNFLEGKSAAGAAILVSKGGEILYKKGFGYADIEEKRLVNVDTKFRIGSVTKQFTGAAILRLQEEGKISVKDKLSKYLPDFPRADEVTIHHLLTHTSGIHSYTGKPEFINKVTSPITEEELIAFIKDDEYDFSPGERWMYNNSAYFLLGHIIGKVSGKPYGEYLKETFFDPLGMSNTGVHASSLKLENEAKGYTNETGEYKRAIDWDMSWAGGAGALYSTVEDLYKWNEALFAGKVLKPQSMAAAFTPVALNNGMRPDNATYGYGWVIGEYRGKKLVEHSGGLHGFLSQLVHYLEQNLTITILTNLTPAEVNLNTAKIAEFVLWESMDKQSSRTVNDAIAQDVTAYTGRYDFANGAIMIISAEGNNLFAQLTGQPRFPIFPSGEGEYFWKVVNAKIKFVKNDQGEVEYGDFEQNGNKLRVKKLPEIKVVNIDKALYKLYEGQYDYGNVVVTISIEGDKLFAQGTNQPKFEIHPVSETEFKVKELNASLQFVKEADGKVNKMVLDMAGMRREGGKLYSSTEK